MDNLLTKFFRTLEAGGLSPVSLKSYHSDIAHFAAWLMFKLQVQGIVASDFTEASAYLTPDLASEYKEFLAKNKLSAKTANRRLSTLRNLARFLSQEGMLGFDFMAQVANINIANQIGPDLLAQYRQHLIEQKASENTIRNYLNDIRHFLAWLEAQNELAN